MKRAAVLLAALAVAGCGQSSDRIWGRSSGYTEARLSSAYIGRPVGSAVTVMGAPMTNYKASDGTETLSWERRQDRGDYPAIFCGEHVTVHDGTITGYSRTGTACGQ